MILEEYIKSFNLKVGVHLTGVKGPETLFVG